MKQIRKRLTYANVMSSIAVFFVLAGGSALAANQLGKNSVGSKQLKKNAVTAAKLKKNAVTAAKIKNGAVTGAKVNVSGFPTVPSATNAGHSNTADHATSADSATNAANANHASNADHATNADSATNFSRYYTSGLKKASVGQTVTLGSIGPFTMVGKCTDEGGGEFSAESLMTTSQPGSFAYSYESGYENANFEPGEEIAIDDGGVSGTEAEWGAYNGYYSDWSAASPDGSVLLQGFANSGVHVFGADCAFNLTWTSNA